jgi:hypothetical protein
MSQASLIPPSDPLLESWHYYAAPEPTNFEEVEVEQNFCSDFVCCGVALPDLHALLQHYEESHVKMEDADDAYTVHPHGYGKYGPPANPKRRIIAVGIEQQDATSEYPSAFDTTVFRTVTPAHHQYYGPNNGFHYAPKRQRAVPAGVSADQHAINTLRAMLPPVFSNTPPDNSLRLIHTALSSTINPPRPPSKKNSCDSGDSEDDGQTGNDRPYACQVSGCGKTYKNPNGLKYHTLHGHDRDGKDIVEKPHRCPFPNCSKRYKNPNGLKYHVQHGHQGQTPPGKTTVASLKSIAGLNQIEAAIKREQAVRAQQAARSLHMEL